MKKSLSLVALLIAAGASAADSPARLTATLESLKAQAGLSQDHALKVRRQHADGQATVHRLQQYYKGLRVWGGGSALREESGALKLVSNQVHGDIHLDVDPTLTRTEARRLVDHRLLSDATSASERGKLPRQLTMEAESQNSLAESDGPKSFRYSAEPSIELVILPVEDMQVLPEAVHKPADQLNAVDVNYVVTGYRLAYHVSTDTFLKGQQVLMNYLVDAHTGEVIKKWDAVKRATVKGTASTKYSGNVTLYTNQNGSTYECKDPVYHNNYVVNKSGTTYTDADNAWGNGGNYADGTTVAQQTGAAEALYALQRTSQMLKSVYGINSFTGSNTAMKVIWGQVSSGSTACYYTQNYIQSGYGDSYFNDMNKIDILGHEYGHALDYHLSGLLESDSGEAGGMSEAHADILGLLAEVYAKYTPNDPNNPATTIPEAGMNDPKTWICGEDAAKSPVNGGKGLRFFIRPSDDTMEGTINAWTSNMANVEVHAAAGPTDRMFYYLAYGAPSSTSHAGYTSYLPNGSTGVGLEKAGRIWMKAMASGELNSNSKHTNARTACINAAKNLYGASGLEEQAVWDAYAGINVGSAWPRNIVSVSITPTTATVQSGSTFLFTAAVTDTSNTAVTWTCTGGSVDTRGLYTAPPVTTTSTFKVRATSVADPSKYAEATVTVPGGPVSVTITPSVVLLDSNANQLFTATVTGLSNTAVTWSCNGGSIDTRGYYTAPYVTQTTTFTVRATAVANTAKFAEASVTVNPKNKPEDKILNGSFELGTANWSGTTGVINTWSAQPAYEGNKCAWICGNGKTATENIYQTLQIPSNATNATLGYYLHIDTAETTTSRAYDKLSVQILNNSGTVLKTLATYSNLNKASGYKSYYWDLSAYKGQTIRISFKGTEDSTLQTSFVLDQVSLIVR